MQCDGNHGRCQTSNRPTVGRTQYARQPRDLKSNNVNGVTYGTTSCASVVTSIAIKIRYGSCRDLDDPLCELVCDGFWVG